jgi:formylglycine-generating enzyme required for sulfatase activity
MKRITFALCSLIASAAFTLAQEDAAPAPADGQNQPPATNAAPAAADGEAATEKPDIKKLIELPEFTNSTGIIMVKISNRLWAGKYEMTQKEYQAIAGSNPSQAQGDSNPVESVSWNDAMSFCALLTEVEKKEEVLPEGMAYSLPTQAQWESFAAGVNLKDAVTGSGATRSGPSAVGSLGANSQGLHDVRGNVWEWCLDPRDKPYRVARGGAWDTFIEVNLRPEFRWYSNGPDDAKNSIGFRCVLAPAGK